MTVEEKSSSSDAEIFKETVLKFYASASETSLKVQKEAYRQLLDTWPLETDKVPDTVPKRLVKLLVPIALLRFDQLRSRRLLSELLFAVFLKHPNPAAVGLTESLTSVFSRTRDGSKYSAKQALYAIKWLCWIIESAQYKNLEAGTKTALVNALQSAVFAVSAVKSLMLIAKKRLTSSFNKNCEILKDLSGNLKPGDAQSLISLPFCGLMLEYLEGKNSDRTVFSEASLEILIQHFLSSKVRLDSVILKSGEVAVGRISREQFQSRVLPMLKKGMLRSPEVCIYAVKEVIRQLRVDLSSDAVEILKQLSPLLLSKEDALREEAEEVVKHLANRCSDSDSVAAMLEFVLGVYNGSQGKITVSAHRVTVLNAIRGLASHGVGGTDAIQKLCDIASDNLLKLLKGEQNEGIQLAGIEALGAWVSKYKTQFPDKVTVFFKEVLSDKKGSSVLKLAYLDILDNCYSTNTLSNAVSLQSALVDILDNGIKGTALPEALAAAQFLLRLSRLDVSLGKLYYSNLSIKKSQELLVLGGI